MITLTNRNFFNEIIINKDGKDIGSCTTGGKCDYYEMSTHIDIKCDDPEIYLPIKLSEDNKHICINLKNDISSKLLIRFLKLAISFIENDHMNEVEPDYPFNYMEENK